MTVRLNKFIAECGIVSRRKVEELILQGRVEVNGKIIMDLAYKVDPSEDAVALDGEKLRQKSRLYFLLNKPKGYVTTTDDEKKRRTVIELIRTREKIFPVGRLDYNTTGVLIITNDGDFSNLLMHPSNRVPRVYRATLDRPLEEADQNRLLKGVFADGRQSRFKEMTFPKKNSRTVVNVTTVEGRNHFVKNMFKTLGYTVVELDRASYAGLTASDLPVGSYRELSKSEVQGLINQYKK